MDSGAEGAALGDQLVGLDAVAILPGVEAIGADAALVAGGHFLDVVLITPQGIEIAFVDQLLTAADAHLAVALQLAIGDPI